ncbi:MAG TPA: YqjK family protein [Burkholderiales bacterium]|nr:YqjK family protein [Burkholderiales bacterium]
MNRHEQGLAARRRELVERSSTQRAALAGAAEPLLRKAAALDRVVGYVRRNPVVTAVAVGAVALLGPQKIFDLGTRAVTLYMLLRR